MINEQNKEIFHWPVVTDEDEQAVLSVLRAGTMSGTDITQQFEREFADYVGTRYALGTCNGTAALQEAFWACGVGIGDEVICPSMTYWASCASALALGASVNFADIDQETLCIDPNDIEHRICERTKAIMVVHYAGYPAEMDRIMAIARRHGVKVIEDVAHAQGALYKGKMCGSIGDIAGTSMMAGKSFAVGEGGMVTTNNRELFERCIAFGHYERTAASRYTVPSEQMTAGNLAIYAGVPLGGVKHRMNQTCSAMGRVQLKHYPQRIAEIQKAMNYFWDQLEGIPGIRAHRVDPATGSTMGGWYNAHGLYRAEELDGLPCAEFCEEVTAAGVTIQCGANYPLHLHPAFHNSDFLLTGKPTMTAFAARDVRQGKGTLPVTERLYELTFTVPWFKHFVPKIIDQYVNVFKKVVRNHVPRSVLVTVPKTKRRYCYEKTRIHVN